MKKQILNLINTLHFVPHVEQRIELFSACCAWTKLTEDMVGDSGTIFDGTASLDKLKDVLTRCVTVHYSFEENKALDTQITKLMTSLCQLMKSNLVTYKDLSDSIKQWAADDLAKYAGHISIPDELAKLGVRLLGQDVDSVYIPFQTGYHFAHSLPAKTEVVCETVGRQDAFFADIHNILLDRDNHVIDGDPILAPYVMGEGGLRQFQHAIAFPPLGLKLPKDSINDPWGRFPEKSFTADVYHLRHMLAQSTDKVVCFVANGFLFRSTAGEKQFKHDILSNNWLDAVIELPAKLLPHTTIPVSIIILDKKKKNNTITFIDASGDYFIDKSNRSKNRLTHIDEIVSWADGTVESAYVKVCNKSDVIANDLNLSVSRYIVSEGQKKLQDFLSRYDTVKLTDLVEIIRPQAVKNADNPDVHFVEYNLSNVNDIGQIIGDGKDIGVNNSSESKISKQRICQNDILVVCRGAVGRVAIVSDKLPDNSIASQIFVILRIKTYPETITSESPPKTITSESLYQYLVSEYGQLQLESLTTGSSIPMLSGKDLSNLQVPLFSPEKLKMLENTRTQVTETYDQVHKLQQKIKTLDKDCLN